MKNIWEEFLKIAICPYCKSILNNGNSEFLCVNCDKIFPIKDDILCFCPGSIEFKYPDFLEADRYIAVSAFTEEVLNRADSTGLYSTINDLFSTYVAKNSINRILDAGCGPGRTTRDIAMRSPNSTVFGIDIAYGMIKRAKELIIDGETVKLNLLAYGWGEREIKGIKLNNVFLVQGDAQKLPFADDSFDCCINVNLIDMANNPFSVLKELLRTLKIGGFFILADPLNWRQISIEKSKMITKEELFDYLQTHGLKILLGFQNLVFREPMDAWGNYIDWNILIILGIKEK